MPAASYPSSTPTSKHDLVGPRLPAPDASLMDALGLLPNAASLFRKMGEPVPPNMKLLATVYSYADGPTPPLSRALYIVGVISETHAVVRKLIGDDDDDEVDASLHRCTLAVKRTDGRHAAQLEEKHVKSSTTFAQLVQGLRREGAAAVLGQDKYGRMGILKPVVVNAASKNGGYDENDFHAACYFGKTSEVKEALVNTVAAAVAVPKSPPPPPGGFDDDDDDNAVVPKSPPPPPGGFNDDGPVWNPDGDEPVFQPDDEAQPQNTNEPSSGGGAALWQPGDDGDNAASSSGLWEAPSSSFNNNINADTGSGLWDPSGGDQNGGSNNGSGLWDPSGGDQTGGASGLWDPSGNDDSGFGAGGGGGGETAASEWDQVDTTSRKRPHPEDNSDDENGNNNGADDSFHANKGAAAADEFYSKLTRNQGTRADSRLYHMRSFNGWVKATQIQELDPRTKGPNGRIGGGPLRILDLACGKGGDLTKWTIHPRGIANYVGSDVARGSLVDAAIRARKMRHKLKRCTFSCADLGHDVPGRLRSSKQKHMQKLLTWSLQDESPHESRPPNFEMRRGGGISESDRFDVVSIQFAIHYMMQTKQRARRFFRTVSQLLEVGGNLICTTIDARVVIGHLMNLGMDLHFDDPSNNALGADPVISVGGGACKITFEPHIVRQIFEDHKGEELPESLFGLEYTFTLVEGSDHGAGVGDAVNLPEWLTPIPVLVALAKEVGLELEYAQNFHEFYKNRSDPSAHAASHMSLYNMKVLNRNGSISAEEWEISRLYVAVKFRKVREPDLAPLSDDEGGADEDEDDIDEIDPAVKTKLMPMAMIKAKKAVGNEAWVGLSTEERMRLTETELKKLVKAQG